MKLISFLLFFLISFKSFSQKYSLESVVKEVFRAINDSNGERLKKITITYDEYRSICEPVIDSSSGDNQSKALQKTGLFNSYQALMAGMAKAFDRDIYWFHYNKNQEHIKFPAKYLNYSYNIKEGFGKDSKIAAVDIFSERDSSIWDMGPIFFYKIRGNWKLAGRFAEQYWAFDLQGRPQYKAWSKNFAHIKKEDFPYAVAENFWNALISDSMAQKLDGFFFAPEEYLKIYKLYEPYESSVRSEEELKNMAGLMKQEYLSEFSRLRDSIIKYGLAVSYKKSFLEDASVSNTMDKAQDYNSSTNRAGKQYGISFHYSIPEAKTADPAYYYLPGINFFFVPGLQKDTWKLLGAITIFSKEPHRMANFPLAGFRDSYNNL